MTAAGDYAQHGWALVPIPKGKKRAFGDAWNERENCRISPGWTGNIGLAHAYSKTAAIDFDALEQASAYLKERGIDAGELLSAPDAVRISSGRPDRAKLIYRMSAPLRTKSIENEEGQTILEFRCATRDGLTVQDVLPPSVHPDTDKPYEWQYNDPMVGDWRFPPAIPDALLSLWQSLVTRAPSPISAPRRDYEHLPLSVIRDRLAKNDPDCSRRRWVEIGMGVHHETRGSTEGFNAWNEWSATGKKYKGHEDAIGRWDSFDWEDDNPTTIATLRVDLQAIPTDFDIVEVPLRRFEGQQFGKFVTGKDAEWLVQGVLPQAELVVIYGESGSGKTFFALDLVATIARGIEWRARRVKAGGVAYICAEGVSGFRRRGRAYARQMECDLSLLPFHVIADAPNLMKPEDAILLAKELKLVEPSVIVIDTLSAVSPGAKENAGEDMGTVIANCKFLHRHTGAVVILIHHSGKDASKGARGWSGLKAAADAEIEITRSDESYRQASISKMKDGEDGDAFGFKLLPVAIGWDSNNDEITSCVIEHVPAQKFDRRRDRGPVAIGILNALAAMVSSDTDDKSVAVDDVIEAVIVTLERGDSKQDQRPIRVKRMLKTLKDDGLIKINDGRVSQSDR